MLKRCLSIEVPNWIGLSHLSWSELKFVGQGSIVSATWSTVVSSFHVARG